MSDAETVVFDRPGNVCFGCSPTNDRGLQLQFVPVEAGVIESRYVVPGHFAGAPGIVHGGIQAALLDEIMGATISLTVGRKDFEREPIVTVDLSVHYLRPVKTGVPLTIRGRIVDRDKEFFFLEAEICGEDGRTCTKAEGRWKMVSHRRR